MVPILSVGLWLSAIDETTNDDLAQLVLLEETKEVVWIRIC